MLAARIRFTQACHRTDPPRRARPPPRPDRANRARRSRSASRRRSASCSPNMSSSPQLMFISFSSIGRYSSCAWRACPWCWRDKSSGGCACDRPFLCLLLEYAAVTGHARNGAGGWALPEGAVVGGIFRRVGAARGAAGRPSPGGTVPAARGGSIAHHQFVYTLPLAAGLATLASIREAEGDAAAALDAMVEAERVAPTLGVTTLLNSVPAQRARLMLAQGDVATAAEWTAESGLGADDPGAAGAGAGRRQRAGHGGKRAGRGAHAGHAAGLPVGLRRRGRPHGRPARPARG